MLALHPHGAQFCRQATGVARPSFTQSHLEGQKLSPQQERIIQWTAAGIYSGTPHSLHRSMPVCRRSMSKVVLTLSVYLLPPEDSDLTRSAPSRL